MEEELPVGLNEQVISMLENVVNENRRLREMIETRDAEQERLLQRVSAKLDVDTSGNSAVSRKRKRKVAVPQQCRVSIFFIILITYYRNLYEMCDL